MGQGNCTCCASLSRLPLAYRCRDRGDYTVVPIDYQCPPLNFDLPNDSIGA